MALIGSHSVLNKNPGRAFGGSTVSDSRAQWNKSGAVRNHYWGEAAFNLISGVPDGTEPPYSWVIPQRGGALSSVNEANGSGTITPSMASGINVETALAGVGILNADATAIAKVLASLAGVGTISSASMIGVVQATANLAGAGTISASLGALVQIACSILASGDITSALSLTVKLESTIPGAGSLTSTVQTPANLVSALTGTGTITSAALVRMVDVASTLAGQGQVTASLKALAFAVATLNGTGTVSSSSNLRGTSNMSADISPFTDLSPQSLAQAVWQALAADFNDAGTMGNKLNGAASAGDPWTTELPGIYPEGSAGKIVGSRLLTLIKYLGLK